MAPGRAGDQQVGVAVVAGRPRRRPKELFVAVTVQVVVRARRSLSARTLCVRLTPPCCGTNATGRCSVGRPPLTASSRISPKYWPVGRCDVIVMRSVDATPGATVNCAATP